MSSVLSSQSPKSINTRSFLFNMNLLHSIFYLNILSSLTHGSIVPPQVPRSYVLEKRTDSATPSPTLSIITTTASGKTIEATFALETLTQYAGLRQTITTTVTVNETATQSNSPPDAALAAAVIGAGGVAYILVGVSGEAGGIILEGPQPPTDGTPSDEPDCPTTATHCKDCGGVSGICLIGVNAGCLCDEEEPCPTGDQQPKCDDTNCEGDEDNQCTKDNEGCACTPPPQPECPADDYYLFCEECGGHQNNICNGVST
jgi:hypothetical protein